MYCGLTDNKQYRKAQTLETLPLYMEKKLPYYQSHLGLEIESLRFSVKISLLSMGGYSHSNCSISIMSNFFGAL